MSDDDLRALAEALMASDVEWRQKGPWAVAQATPRHSPFGWDVVAEGEGILEDASEVLARYIAAVHPQRILSLLDERDEARAEVERLRAERQQVAHALGVSLLRDGDLVGASRRLRDLADELRAAATRSSEEVERLRAEAQSRRPHRWFNVRRESGGWDAECERCGFRTTADRVRVEVGCPCTPACSPEAHTHG